MADIMTPALGESVAEATVARWTKKVGDTVKKDEVLVELDTDKVSLEVPAPADGVLESISAGEGERLQHVGLQHDAASPAAQCIGRALEHPHLPAYRAQRGGREQAGQRAADDQCAGFFNVGHGVPWSEFVADAERASLGAVGGAEPVGLQHRVEIGAARD